MVIHFYPTPVIAWGQNDNPLSFRPAQDITQRISSHLTKVDQVSSQPAYPAEAIGAGIANYSRCIQQRLLPIYNYLKQSFL